MTNRGRRGSLAGLVSVLLACVTEGDRPVVRDVPSGCSDRCDEIFPDPAPCVVTWWHADTCSCELVLAEDDAPCDDGNACTFEDRCDGGLCRGDPVDLVAFCDDHNACTSDRCDTRDGCVHDPVAPNVACDDGNVCTIDSRCNGFGQCRWRDQYVCGLCDPDDPSACAAENVHQDRCDGRLVCLDGYCQVDPATVPRCDDPRLDPCLVARCDDGECVTASRPDGTSCSDRSSCTRDDACRGGVCTGTPTGGAGCACETAADCRPLDDDDRCSGGPTCRDGVCVFDFASLVVCDDQDDGPCSVTRCISETGECAPITAADDEPCDDGDPCTLDDACLEGTCAGSAIDCSDLDARCLVGRCDRLLGCIAELAPSGTACRAATPCSGLGECDGRGGCIAPPAVCDDGDPCTIDTCDADGVTCVSYGPERPSCASQGVCADGVPLRCEAGEYVCDYAGVAAWSPVERCDGRDDDCDGETDERCIAAEACVDARAVAAWGDAMQACGGETAAVAELCAPGWHVCDHSAMLEALAGERPPPAFYLAAAIHHDPASGYQVVDTNGVCTPFEGECGGAYAVQAMTWDGLFAGAIAYAAPAWGCADDTATTSCADAAFEGVMCCVDACDDDADCRDADACSEDTCQGGRCRSRRPALACPSVGVCAGSSPRCGDDGTLVCGLDAIDGYEQVEVSCDGRDNDCDGLSDGHDPDLMALEVACERQLGVCAGAQKGVERCAGGAWSACEASDYLARSDAYEDGAETSCDGLDNDCDGAIDEGSSWGGAAIGQPCKGSGACGLGVVECAPSGAATCSSNPLGSASQAIAEVCNGLDDDCDGATDEAAELGAADCPELGVCAGLVQARCVEGAWACELDGIEGYGEERCDGRDNDCDGATDEGFVTAQGGALGASCGPPSCPNGQVICAEDGAGAVCSSDVDPNLELCDGVDNDCDGLTDEGVSYDDAVVGARVLGESCSGRGACGPGLVECGPDGAATCSTLGGSQVEATVERCNGSDDDCDGITDEGFAWQTRKLGDPCSGLGECGAGTVVCSADGARATCSSQPDGTASEATAEVCNGRDDDCDGASDDDVVPGAGDCPSAGVCRPAILDATCLGAAGWRCDFSASPYFQEGDESGRCDRLDNDCDGATDEDFAALGQRCDGPDADECAHGVVVCDTGDPTRTICSGDAASAEVCNGVDDDCDGATDEEGAGGCTVYLRDRDGFGTSEAHCLCEPTSDRDATVGGDCDDGDAAIHPQAPERCNGVDDDCDGKTDALDAADLLVADPRPCEEQRGVCQGSLKGADLCVAGAWEACGSAEYQAFADAYQSPKETRCDGLDNDCDGASDGADADIAASPPPCARQHGVCAGARKPTSLCTANGWAACDDGTYAAWSSDHQPGVETLCDGLDNDCDGVPDDDFRHGAKAIGESCDGVGACGLGTVECAFDERGATCSSDPDGSQPQDGDEICNGVDDDCDGLTDEQLGLAQSPCRVAGVCAAGTVMATCALGAWSCDYSAVAYHEPGQEVSCDGRDNDCDGGVDEDMVQLVSGRTVRKGEPCGSGSCVGVVVCDDTTPAPGDLVCSSAGGGGELCDGQDNDCDGETDEGFPELGTACDRVDDDDACALGTWLCGQAVLAAGGSAAEAQSGVPVCAGDTPSPERCGGGDEDCDGSVDEEDAVGCFDHYYDGDGDGWGIAEDSRCLCAEGDGVVTGHTTPLDGDCCDADERVNPEQGGWFAGADACGSFDYDCSTQAEREHPSAGACTCPEGLCALGGCTHVAGWVGAVPACGQSQSFVTGCGLLCLEATEPRTQRCR